MQRPGYLLIITSVLISLFMILPLIYVALSGIQAPAERWMKLYDIRITFLLWNTLSLAAVVTFFSVSIGFSLSWLIIRTDIPGKKYWQWLMALPMVIPSYVGAMCYISIFGPRGWLRDILGYSLFDFYGFIGAAFVLTMFTYPYVFLITSAALKKLNMNYEEVGLSLGLSYRMLFLKVILPAIRPAIGAGAILTALYVLSDFGTVGMLRYTTFTSAIYFHIASFDQQTASILSSVLIFFTLLFLYIEAKSREKQKFYQIAGALKKIKIIELGRYKLLMLSFVIIIFLLATAIPVMVLIYWSVIGFREGNLDYNFLRYAYNTFMLGAISALICVLISLPIVYLRSRYPSFFSDVIEKCSYMGFSFPGVIVALGIIFIFNQYLPLLYNTVVMMVVAYVIRFFPKALQAENAAIDMVSPRLDEAAKSLGYTQSKIMFNIILPIILPGVLAAAALVFVSSVKELPATLLLRPPGFDTLTIRVWIEASEYFYHQASPPALLIILISVLPLKWMLKKY